MNWPVALIAFVFWFNETSYFGWNAVPHSTAELFADGLALAMFALAFPRKMVVQITIKDRA